MGLLTPLYIAGALAVSLPLVFHLIRRTPKGETPFSSLMFLAPSPPRLTRRSRLDQILLLVLRGLALTLLALAFARPFLRQAANQVAEDSPQERIAILLDGSVSMRREDLWQQAVEAADDVMAEARPLDSVGVYLFDETLRPVASFDDLAQVPPGQRRSVVRERLGELSPTWSSTRMGQAIVDAIDAAGATQDASEQAGRAPRRIVLVSDMQSGGRIDMLGQYDWPEDVQLQLKPVKPRRSSNAGLQRLADESAADRAAASDDEAARTGRLRIRVANAAESAVEQFRLEWIDERDRRLGSPIDAYVPAGESRVVRIAPPKDATGNLRLELTGDDHSFDNTLYYVPPQQQQLTVVYYGVDPPDDPQQARYYLETALSSDASREVEIAAFQPGDSVVLPEDNAPLAVATAPPTLEQCRQLRNYMEQGGAVLYVVGDEDDGAALAELAGVEQLDIEAADVEGYAMLRDIDFSHAMFAPMAGPQYNDFTQIRFWNYRRIDATDLPEARAVARFEGGDPAVLEQRIGSGRLLVLTASWKPSDGQLARSWKYLLMMSSLVEFLSPERDFREDFVVNQLAPLPEGVELAASRTVTKPDGSAVAIPDAAAAFGGADQPGVYALALAEGTARFAVNIDPVESDTSALATEQFEQLGVHLSGREKTAVDLETEKQLRDIELERRQSIWKWLIAVVLAILIVETWLAGRASRQTAFEPATA